ncbi:PadR family transcriptional regulator [Nonomuraea sp. NPDC050022]|uniref:PadR family transcriptional regulator n=1 Tax=unclassified Nonomuraea TaxID=2593643 RepID=UPI0033E5D78C
MTTRRSPLAMAVLGLLAYQPLHPYGMQSLIKQWGKDEVINVGQRTTLYKTINRLHEASLITVHQTERDQQYPERTVYALTEQGREALQRWMGEMLTTPRNEFPEFPAALSFLPILTPEQTLGFLRERHELLQVRLARLEAALGEAGVPRVSLLETEYLRAATESELRWVTGVLDDLRAGRLTWSEERLRAFASDHLEIPED